MLLGQAWRQKNLSLSLGGSMSNSEMIQILEKKRC